MLGNLQKAAAKKVEAVSAMRAPVATTPVMAEPKKRKPGKIRRKKGPKKQNPQKPMQPKPLPFQQKIDNGKEETEEESDEEDEGPKPAVQDNLRTNYRPPIEYPTQKPFGQVSNHKPDPKQCAQRILRSERPDLFAGVIGEMNADDLKILDDFLVKKGILKGGVTLTIGKVVEMESKVEVGSGNEVDVLMIYAYGRFGNVYIAYKEPTDEQERKGVENFYALKSSRRCYATTRIQNEIAILEHLWNPAKKGSSIPAHIVPVFFHGTVGGTPYFMMPLMDVNLEKLRQEVGNKVTWADAFFIAKETLLGIKECHTFGIIHRDIKPTNVLLGAKNSNTFWLCDFGDSCRHGAKQILSAPDAMTLPYMSREAHKATREMVPATIGCDVESWFYMVFDLFIQLPWKLETEEAETLAGKQNFWSHLDQFFQQNAAVVPPQLHPLAQTVMGTVDGHIYNKLTVILKDGFLKYSEGGGAGWKPSWVDKRKKMGGMVFPNMRGRGKTPVKMAGTPRKKK